MKALHGSTMKRRVLGLMVLSLAVCVVAVYAVDLCHTHTGNGTLFDYFSFPGEGVDIYLDAKAPSSGNLWAFVCAAGQNIVGQINVSDGARSGTTISWTLLNRMRDNDFNSQVSNHTSGTGYAQLSNVGGKKSVCIPSGTPH